MLISSETYTTLQILILYFVKFYNLFVTCLNNYTKNRQFVCGKHSNLLQILQAQNRYEQFLFNLIMKTEWKAIKLRNSKTTVFCFIYDNKALVLSVVVFVIGAILCITILKAVYQGKWNFYI